MADNNTWDCGGVIRAKKKAAEDSGVFRDNIQGWRAIGRHAKVSNTHWLVTVATCIEEADLVASWGECFQ